jgi:hypothetical protein
MESKTLQVRMVANGYIVEIDHPVDGAQEMVFAKYYQVMRFVKEFLKEEE